MLHKCANPACSNVFRRLSEGKLFQVESEYLEAVSPGKSVPARNPRGVRKVEHYWLCNDCSSFLTLIFDRGQGMITVPLPASGGRKMVTAVGLEDLQPATGPRVSNRDS
ncbi:MAG TPA: hypothetical protein VMT28_09715 [Terriglobales bacterium]|jgi:hypothetical protein|nr:hypothetical protein [Terriglobales bacterium]